MKTSAPRPATKKSAGAPKRLKIRVVTRASADEIRKTLGITPAEMRVAAKAIAAAKKSSTSLDRPVVVQKPKSARESAAKRIHAR